MRQNEEEGLNCFWEKGTIGVGGNLIFRRGNECECKCLFVRLNSRTHFYHLSIVLVFRASHSAATHSFHPTDEPLPSSGDTEYPATAAPVSHIYKTRGNQKCGSLSRRRDCFCPKAIMWPPYPPRTSFPLSMLWVTCKNSTYFLSSMDLHCSCRGKKHLCARVEMLWKQRAS